MQGMYKQAKRLIVDKKTGFRNSTGKPIIIYDQRGKPFYDTRELDHVVWQFNLPKGEFYLYEGKIVKMPMPVDYPLLPLPKPERNKRGIPEHFDVYFADNPHKATVFWDLKAMLFDNKLKDVSLPALVTIYQHECGHKYYETEEFCDRYAYNKMIEAGYNPSQVATGFVNTLSEKQLPRKNALVNAMFGQTSNYDHYEYDESETDHLEVQKNDVIYTIKDITGYNYKGEKILIKHPAKGVVKNVSTNFVFVGDRGDYIPKNSAYTIESSVGSIPAQAWRDMQIFFTGNPVSVGVVEGAKKVAETSKDIVSGVTDAVSSGLDIFGFVGKNLKWILLILALLYLAPYILPTIKETIKAAK